MAAGAPVTHPTHAPLVTLRAASAAESDAIRGLVRRIERGRTYLLSITAAPVPGCVAEARMRLPAGNGGPVHFALAPRGIWCAGTLVVRVRATRAGSPTGVTRLRVRSPEALGAGNVVGHLLLGPTCPVEREDDPCDPVARPQPVTIVAFDELGIEAGRTQTLGDGSFALELPAGRFRLHGEVPGGSPPRIGDATISVSPSATREHPLRATVSGDTGIR